MRHQRVQVERLALCLVKHGLKMEDEVAAILAKGCEAILRANSFWIALSHELHDPGPLLPEIH